MSYNTKWRDRLAFTVCLAVSYGVTLGSSPIGRSPILMVIGEPGGSAIPIVPSNVIFLTSAEEMHAVVVATLDGPRINTPNHTSLVSRSSALVNPPRFIAFRTGTARELVLPASIRIGTFGTTLAHGFKSSDNFFCSSLVNIGCRNAATILELSNRNRSASFSFADARSFALAASPSTSATSWRVASRISLSIFPARVWIANSPATPIATRPAPSSSNANFAIFGFPGELIVPRRYSWSSFWYSVRTIAISITTPTTTSAVQKLSQLSREDQEASRLLSLLSRADMSMKRFYEHAEFIATVQAVVIGILFLSAILIGIFIHIRGMR